VSTGTPLSPDVVEPDADSVRPPRPGPAEAAGPAAPSAAPERSPAITVVSTALIVVGTVAVLFAAFALWGSHLVQARDQDRLRGELALRFTIDRASEDAGGDQSTVVAGSEFGGEPAEGEDAAGGGASGPKEPEAVGPPGPGDPIALLRVPAIGVNQVVVNGSAAEQLRLGPGHLRGTSRPGEKGNVVIAGKRATYGAPFADLDRLRRGDEIELSTAAGTYTYEVDKVDTLEPAEDEDVVGPTEANVLTLVTAEPRYQARERLVVRAEFAGEADDPPLVVVPPGFEPRPDELGLGRDPTAWASIVLFVVLVALTVAGLVWARRRWTGWAVWVVGAPILVGLGVLLFENLLRWFPSTV
jgi:sortase A